MVISAKQKQKKLDKKKKKRKDLLKTQRTASQIRGADLSYATSPIHECLAPNTLFETGIGYVVIARKTNDGLIAVSAFVLDVFCLGVKNALFKVSSEIEYETKIKHQLLSSGDDEQYENIHPACARKLIEGAASYAKELGFFPHRDYKDAKVLFGNIDVNACPEKYVYGKNGKPFYISGPNESAGQSKRIVDQLRKRCGEENYEYIAMFDGSEFE